MEYRNKYPKLTWYWEISHTCPCIKGTQVTTDKIVACLVFDMMTWNDIIELLEISDEDIRQALEWVIYH